MKLTRLGHRVASGKTPCAVRGGLCNLASACSLCGVVSQTPLSQWIDTKGSDMNPITITALVVLLVAGAGALRFCWQVRRDGAPNAPVLAGSLGLLSGSTIAMLGVIHFAAVTRLELRRSPVHYDFRVYALLLLGVTLTVLGTWLAAASVRFARGEMAAGRPAISAAVALLVVNVPLGPLQGIAVLLCLLVAVSLAALLATAGHATKAA